MAEQPRDPQEAVLAEELATGHVTRGRPGRRSHAERHQAVLEVLSGKASVDQVALALGVHARTVEQWREQALAGMEEALLRGDAASPRERELERENRELRSTLQDVSVRYAIAQKAVDEWAARSRPTRPARSGRR